MSAASVECILFAGPSARDAELRLDGIELRLPAQRGDVEALIEAREPGVMALADGVFHQSLAVGHAELRDAVDCGWQVLGLSSLGAIRACEMRHLGMRGYGVVYRHFVADGGFSDDEVALRHAPDAPYQALSEPLIHIRIGLQALVVQGAIAPSRRRALLNRLKKKNGGTATGPWGSSRRRCSKPARDCAAPVDAWLAGFQQYRVKSTDLQDFLRTRPFSPATSRTRRSIRRPSCGSRFR